MLILRNIASFVKNGGPYHFKLVLKSKVFYIPSEFPNLNDVDQDIYSTLISNRQYNVLSNVSEKVFQYFINNWVYNTVPDIQKDNFYEYEQLAKEFDRMKDIIQMNNFNIILKNKKEALTKLINEKKLFRDFQNKKYHKIISIYNKYNTDIQLKYPIRVFKSYDIEALGVLI